MDIGLAIILHPSEQKILISRRSDTVHLAGYWEFPGGKCNYGESLSACALREAYEEVGVIADIVESWPTITHEYPERTVNLHPFLCKARSAAIVEHGMGDTQWVSISDLENFAFPEANGPLVKRIQELDSGQFSSNT